MAFINSCVTQQVRYKVVHNALVWAWQPSIILNTNNWYKRKNLTKHVKQELSPQSCIVFMPYCKMSS